MALGTTHSLGNLLESRYCTSCAILSYIPSIHLAIPSSYLAGLFQEGSCGERVLWVPAGYHVRTYVAQRGPRGLTSANTHGIPFFFFNFTFQVQLVGGFTLRATFWTSRGYRCRSPRHVPSILSRIGFSIPTARRFSSNVVANSRPRAFR